MQPYIHRIGPIVKKALDEGKTVLSEAAQGTLLDLEQGTYPYVTSSCTTAAGVFSGLGIGDSTSRSSGRCDQILPDARRVRTFPD